MARNVTIKQDNNAQAHQQNQPVNMQDIASASLSALTAAQQAVEQAKQMLEQAGIQTGDNATPAANRSNGNRSNTSSGGRIASPDQMAIREEITEWCHSTPDLFTIKSMTEQLGKDRVQVRNAIAALEASGIVQRWAEKLPEGRGAREIIYKPSIADVGL